MSEEVNNLKELSQLYAFLGNSLLKPIRQTEAVGISPAFWANVPSFGSDGISLALDNLFDFAQTAERDAAEGKDVITELSVEYTRLFVGPPSPAAPPWETYYPEQEGVNVTCGFGEPTFAMKALLREEGLQISGENHQFEDHMGIELLYISTLLLRAAEGETELFTKVSHFICEHPRKWIDRLCAKVVEAFPEGYMIKLLRLAKALMELEYKVLANNNERLYNV